MREYKILYSTKGEPEHHSTYSDADSFPDAVNVLNNLWELITSSPSNDNINKAWIEHNGKCSRSGVRKR